MRILRDQVLAQEASIASDAAMTRPRFKLRAAFNGQLTDEMKDDLRRQGLDPDELEADEPLDQP